MKCRTEEAGDSNKPAKAHVRHKYKPTSAASIRYSGQCKRKLSIALADSGSMTSCPQCCTKCRLVVSEVGNDIRVGAANATRPHSRAMASRAILIAMDRPIPGS